MFIHQSLARFNGKSRRLVLVGVFLFTLLFFVPTARRLDWSYSDSNGFNDQAFDVNGKIAQVPPLHSHAATNRRTVSR